ncbi:MAG: hypothetical protein GXP42_19085 [Chloroflexi bacterium]|nr:hypothetical protein [Chloroflexota bacterium]
MSSRRYFLAILLIYLFLATAFSVTQPLGEAPDEADHYAYLRYIALHRALPQGPAVTQGKHPPLYYALAAGLTAWTGVDFDFLRANPDAFPLGPDAPPNFFVHTTLEAFPWRGGALAMHLARFLSVALGAITLWGAWRLGGESFPEHPQIGLLAAAFLAGLPGFLYISGAINNDNAAGAMGALALLMMARIIRRGASWARAGGLGLLLGLGLLSKVGVLSLWPLAALAFAAAYWPQRRQARAWAWGLAHLALTWGVGLFVASPWLVRNWRLYGDFLGWSLVRQTIDLRAAPLSLQDYFWLFKGLYTYFWGRFGPIGQVWLPTWVYALGGGLVLLLLAGVVHYVRRMFSPGPRAIFSLLLLAFAPMLVLASVVRYSYLALGTDQARLMWPAVSALAVWVGVGVTGLTDKIGLGRHWPRVTLAFIALWPVAGLSAWLFVLRPAFAPPRPIEPAALPSSQTSILFGDAFELVAAEWSSDPMLEDQPIEVRLYWRATAPLAQDLRPVVRLVHEDGWLAAEHDHSPAQGRYATDRWRPGEIIADVVELVPNPAGQGRFWLQVGVRPFRGDWLPIEGVDESFYTIGEVRR